MNNIVNLPISIREFLVEGTCDINSTQEGIKSNIVIGEVWTKVKFKNNIMSIDIPFANLNTVLLEAAIEETESLSDVDDEVKKLISEEKKLKSFIEDQGYKMSLDDKTNMYTLDIPMECFAKDKVVKCLEKWFETDAATEELLEEIIY